MDKGLAVLSVRQENGNGDYEMSFDLHSRTLVRVSQVSADAKTGIITNAAGESFVSMPTGYPVIFDWLRMPAEVATTSRVFHISHGIPVEEQIIMKSAAAFDVSFTCVDRRTPGFVQSIHSLQSWQVGKPWWSSAAAKSEIEVEGEKLSDWSISGRLL